MRDFSLTSADHILAQGVKFWTSVVEDHQIEELDQCYQVITALGEFLRTNIFKSKDDEQPSSEKEIKTDLHNFFDVIEMSDVFLEDISEDISTVEDENSGKTEVKPNDKDYEETDKENHFTSEFDPTAEEFKKDSKRESIITGSKNCEHCDKIFSSLNDLGKHIASTHEAFLEEFEQKYKKFQCEDCSFKCYTLRRWYKHQKGVHALRWHERKEKSFHCQKCGTDFIGINRFKKHSLYHKACHLCSKVLNGSKLLRKHLEKHNEPKKPKEPKEPEICSICGKRFKTLIYHRKKEHGMSGLNCRFCNLAFNTDYRRETHEFEVHNSNAEICILCGKKIKKCYLEKHMTSHSEKNLPCELCVKSFKNSFHLERHHKKVHTSDDEKPHKCSHAGCMRAFMNVGSLESHMNSHLGLKPYKCTVCETRFQNPSNRSAHMRKVHKVSKIKTII